MQNSSYIYLALCFFNDLQYSLERNTLLMVSRDPFKMSWETDLTRPASHAFNTTSIYWIIADYDVKDASNKGFADKSPNEDIMESAHW